MWNSSQIVKSLEQFFLWAESRRRITRHWVQVCVQTNPPTQTHRSTVYVIGKQYLSTKHLLYSFNVAVNNEIITETVKCKKAKPLLMNFLESYYNKGNKVKNINGNKMSNRMFAVNWKCFIIVYYQGLGSKCVLLTTSIAFNFIGPMCPRIN